MKHVVLWSLLLLLVSCKPKINEEPLTMIIGTWYGFYPIYYALEQELDKKHGLRLKVLEPTNMANYRRSYLREQVDVAASSMLEFTNASTLTGSPMQHVVITDYSNGGDVIVATKDISNKQDLIGKRVAVPSNGIGEYVLSLALKSMTPTELIEQIKIPETECEKAFKSAEIDACVTYPPISTYLLENENLHVIYTTKEDVGRVFDVFWAKPHVAKSTIQKLRRFWFEAVELVKQDEQAYFKFVASIANVEVSSVAQSMQGIKLLRENEYKALLQNREQLARDLYNACIIATAENCEQFDNAFIEQ